MDFSRLAGSIRTIVLAVVLVTVFFPARGAEPTADSRKLAAELPIADLHMHLYRGLTPAELKSRMDRNNIRWAGGVGPVMPGIDTAPFIALLGERYLPMLAQPEFHYLFTSGGAAALDDANRPAFKNMMAAADNLLKTRAVHGFGELIVNNKASNQQPKFRRKASMDSATMRAMFDSAQRNGGVVQIHTEDDEDSVAGLEALHKAYPAVPIILSHCLAVTKDTQTPRRMLQSSPLIYCDLSARSASAKGRKDRRIFGPNFVEPEWLDLIEAFPDQFVVGTDVADEGHDFDKVVGDIRNGLLPRLSAETANKVAYLNAMKLFDLKLN
jgi:predicted TIM-barrel fold metal-dependent hydrolase